MDKTRAALFLETSFPTGNGLVVIRDDEVLLDRELRDSTGDRWYWHVRATAAQDTELRVRLARPLLLGQFGPAARTADEYHWLWPIAGPDTAFDLQIAAGTTVYASATIPYGAHEMAGFRRRLGSALWWGDLTTSEGGRGVPVVKVRAPESRRVILLTGRHHACEAMASFVLEGAIEEFVALRRDGDATARTSELIALPMMDVDGVHDGDQGKARTPWDHNRDYGPTSRYQAVSALRSMLANERRAVYALDLHTPGLRGPIEERPYVVASADPGDAETAAELLNLLNAADGRARGGSRLLLFEYEWNSSSSSGQRCCAAWLRSLPLTRLATTIEYPNAVDRGQPINPADARDFGAILMRSLLTMVE
ncbi:hypothetical protein M8C13_07435 [Crossiella sp. SN42]|uniref:M14 family zinc carboxypeptidase n=1 Tax=Crossiella sp. SN42 TaxID=2944808 RepID=UPI00207CA504|nr:M14 family zinc carboxypeptidase [Crossiella sp. SN42]MCO1575589.1 hypothetical protein [Crossiella sp. SN42]